MPDKRCGGVIFDVDGTLLDTNYLHVVAWWEAFRERGHEIRCADVYRALDPAALLRDIHASPIGRLGRG